MDFLLSRLSWIEPKRRGVELGEGLYLDSNRICLRGFGVQPELVVPFIEQFVQSTVALATFSRGCERPT